MTSFPFDRFVNSHGAPDPEAFEDISLFLKSVTDYVQGVLQKFPIGTPLITLDQKPDPTAGIVKKLENQNFYLKLTTFVCATVGSILAIKRLNEWWNVRKVSERILANRSQRGLEELSQAETCIVCLTNPREIILMDCGHVAVCADCCSKLNGKCPVCRRTIRGTHAAYIA